MHVIARRLEASYPEADKGRDVSLLPLHDFLVGPTRSTLLLLLGAVAFLLLLACVNVGSLILARTSARKSELAVRFALGASRWRVVRQLTTESLVLLATGYAMGLALAYWGQTAIRVLAAHSIPRLEGMAISAPVLEFAAGISLVAVLFFGLIPALRASAIGPYDSIRRGGTTGKSSPGAIRERGLIVAAQTALAFILLAGAGLLVNSFLRLSRVNPGFRTQDTLSFQLSLPRSRYQTNPQQNGFFNQVISRVASLPGVQGAGGVSDLPLLGNRMGFKIRQRGDTTAKPSDLPLVGIRLVTPGYFQTIGMALR
ncbi:MAG: FtsX-like permease family protein, partial [Bryobacteraceae bacterium]